MGCTQSTAAPEAAPPVAEKSLPAQEQALPVAPPPQTSSSPAKPMPFAIMRNCHETLRACFKDLDAAVEAKDMDAFDITFRDMTRGLKYHTKLEEHGLFDLLDRKFDDVAEGAGLRDLHVEDDKLQNDVVQALEQKKDMEQIKPAYEAWKKHSLEHLKAVEAVMMPKIQEIGKEVEGDPQKMGEIFNENILGRNIGDGREFAWFVAWNARVLAKHGSTSQDGFIAMKTFVWGCQYACTETQWDSVWPTLKKEMSVYFPEMYEKLNEENDIEGPGKVPTSKEDSDVWC